MTDYHLAMCPAKADGTIDWQSGDGAGPYKIVDHESGVATKLVHGTMAGTWRGPISTAAS